MGKIRKHKVFDWLTMIGHDESRSGPPLWSTQQTPRRPDLGGAFCTTLPHVYKAKVLKPSRQGRPCPERHRAGGKLSSIPTTPEDRAPIVAEPSRLRKHGVIRPLPGDLGRAGVQNGLVEVDDIKTRGPMANRAPDHLRVVQKNAEGFEVSMQEPGIAKGLLCHVAPHGLREDRAIHIPPTNRYIFSINKGAGTLDDRAGTGWQIRLTQLNWQQHPILLGHRRQRGVRTQKLHDEVAPGFLPFAP